VRGNGLVRFCLSIRTGEAQTLRQRLILIPALVMMLLACNAAALATTVRAICTVPVQLSLPLATQSDTPQAFIRGDEGPWQPARYELDDGRIIFQLRPAQLGGHIMLLINPPADLDIHDTNPPQLVGLKVDEKPLPAEKRVHLGASSDAPRQIRAGFADAENTLELASVLATLNGLRVPAERISVTSPDPGRATVTLELGHVEYGRHRAVISIADASPMANAAQVSVDFERADTTNFLLASIADIKMQASSHFPNYESLAALNDGFKELSGGSCGNDVSWASSEGPNDHWLEVTMPQERTVGEVTIYWAYAGATYHTSQSIMIQVPDDGAWRNVYTSPPEGHQPGPCTTFAFDPVKTDRFRIYQPAGGGGAGRPNLMWLAEVEAR
jgi:hypothetical protein